MQWLGDVVVGVIAGYLAATSFMADQIIAILPSDPTSETITVVTEESEGGNPFFTEIVQLPSRITDIPDILRRSSEYQRAAVIGSAGFTEPTANAPIDAIVNVFCTLQTDDSIRTTTGTGFFIDADGVIMTNAHVAQFLLLAESAQYNDAECLIRTGNPAAPQYLAELLYLPPAWIQENATVLNDAVPLGTGERDYALLYVSDTVGTEPLPAQFPALGFNSELVSTSIRNNTVTAAGYPATSLLQDGRSAILIPRQADTTVSELYTFGSNYADVISIRGSAVGAQGSSGGPVVNEDGEVIGMIATRGDDSLDGEGSLRAITLSHIDRTIEEETGFTLAENLGGNHSLRSEVFAETLAPFLLTILEFETVE